MSAPTLPAALAGLMDPAAYAHRPANVELRETHISWVLLAEELAFKLKKPLRLVVATDRSPEASVLAARDALDERLASS